MIQPVPIMSLVCRECWVGVVDIHSKRAIAHGVNDGRDPVIEERKSIRRIRAGEDGIVELPF